MRKLVTIAASTLVVVTLDTGRASAEWLLTPYAGYNWGSVATVNDITGSYEDQFSPQLDFGAVVTWPKGALAFEFDFGYHLRFMEDRPDQDENFPAFNWADSRVMTFMGNVTYSPGFLHLGKVRGFGSGGAGLIQSHAADALLREFLPEAATVDSSTFGINAGGGVTLPLTGAWQLRGDVRYFRGLENKPPSDPLATTMGNLSFWRGTVGVTLHF